MMHTWADYLDSLKAGAVVIPLFRTTSFPTPGTTTADDLGSKVVGVARPVVSSR